MSLARPVERNAVLRLLADHREELACLGVRTLTPFGSVARDEAGEGSDVDLVVEFEGRATFDRYAELSLYLEEILGGPVDLLTQRSLNASLRSAVDKEALHVPGLSPLS